jgi:hypothetical protein
MARVSAPLSWPSSPGFAIKTLIGLLILICLLASFAYFTKTKRQQS